MVSYNRPQGFYVITAYPRNDDFEKENKMQEFRHKSAFLSFTDYMIQDYEIFEDVDELISFGLTNMQIRDATAVEKLAVYLQGVLKSNLTDQQLEDLWTGSHADFFILKPHIRPFLENVLKHAKVYRPNVSS